ncbi:MAG: TonB-dependent receptor domain-containing protein [bacterium]|jgi:outer membrane receptor protein involved in Fe transport
MNLRPHILTASCTAFVLAAPAHAQDAGTLRGVVTDRDFGGAVAGATVTVIETGAKAQTDQDGAYSLSLPPGRYTVVVSKDGFVRQLKTNVALEAGQMSSLDAELVGEYEDMDEFVVQELELGGTEAALLTLRVESPQLLDSVGAEILSKSGASDAAAALLLVPGASVQDGKYAVIRGLPDRYVSAQLDGVRLPTSDAERRAVQLDQFPTAVIQSVQVSKTFTPDQQGDASGGAINIDLKDIPEESSFQIKGQAGFNSQAAGRDDFLTYSPGGGVSPWGTNQGRDIPFDIIGDTWPNAVGTTTKDSPLDWKWSASGGGKWELDEDVRVGGFLSFFYDRDSSFYDNGVEDSWFVTPVEGLVPEYFGGNPASGEFQSSLLDVTQASESVQWGGLGTFGIETPNHKLGVALLYTRMAENTAVLATNTRGKAYFVGPDFIPGNPVYDPTDPAAPGNNQYWLSSPYQRLETLVYTEETTASTIFSGEHKLDFSGDEATGEGESDDGLFDTPILDWRLSFSEAVYDQPDKTQFSAYWLPPSNDFFPPPEPGAWLALRPAESTLLGWAQHIWQKVTESSDQIAVNLKLPFTLENDRVGYTKFGVFGDSVQRSYTQSSFTNENDPDSFYIAGWDEPWSTVFPTQNHPMVESIYDVDYDGYQRVGALYGMIDMPLGEQFNIIGGLRMESTTLQTEVFGGPGATWFLPGGLAPISFAGDPRAADVDFQQTDFLPQVGLQYEPSEGLVFRASVSKTIARQTFRELTPILQQEFLGGPIFIGNPLLDLSSLKNYDIRVDYTPAEGWFFSGSLFYKSIEGPIEYAQFVSPQNFSYTTPVNYPEGTMRGVELEARVKMDAVDERLKGLALGANTTFIDSSVELPADERDDFDFIGYPISSRPMTGTPDFLLNFNATYEIEETGTQLGLFYNLSGTTLEAGAGAERLTGVFIPSVYALPYATLNFTLQQSLGEHWKIFFQAKNILNPEIETVYRSEYLPADVLNTSYTAGVDFAVGLSFQMDF